MSPFFQSDEVEQYSRKFEVATENIRRERRPSPEIATKLLRDEKLEWRP